MYNICYTHSPVGWGWKERKATFVAYKKKQEFGEIVKLMFAYDEIIKIVWFISLIIDLVIYKKFYEEIILGPLKVILNTLQIILGLCFFICIIDLVYFWHGFWECLVSAILLLSFNVLQRYMFITHDYSKTLKIIEKVCLLFGSSLLSLFCSIGMGLREILVLNCIIIITGILILLITLKKESKKLDWIYLLLHYGNISFYIGWMVL